jgi:hypothetical protein
MGGSRPVKRKMAGGLELNQIVAATGEVAAIFQASNLALPAATVDEAQQASG